MSADRPPTPERTPPRPASALLADRAAWRSAGVGAQDAAAAAVAAALGAAFVHTATETYRCGALAHRLAVFRHEATGMLLHLLPGDPEFMAGSPAGLAAEGPLRRAPVAPLLVGRHPVRVAEWRRLAGVDPTGGGDDGSGDHPAGGVSWHAARRWLEAAGGGLRLPREHEWEYACRAGAPWPWFWGDAWDPAWCWTLENAGGRTQPVGLHAERANAFGLVDPCGNVSEWCDDDLDLPMEGSAWQEGDPGKVHRGGSFDFPSSRCRPAYRAGSDPSAAYPDLGFRAFRALPGPRR